LFLPSVMSNRTIIGLILLGLTPAFLSFGQATAVDPTALVRRATQHRLDASRNHQPLRYLLRKIDERHDTTKDIIETKDGDVARLVAIGGRPLTAEENQAELARLNTLSNHPEIQERRHQHEQKDADRVNRLMRLLPDAFLYRFEGMVSCAQGQCYRLSFSPNPRFVPPDVEANIFRGLAGEVLIDQTQERLTRLEAHLISDVDFGWGILGRLDKGGTVLLQQEDIGGHDWEVTEMKLNMTGKALMLKSLNIKITQEANHFSTVVPAVDYREAIKLLEK
jgi:hypothetical protein